MVFLTTLISKVREVLKMKLCFIVHAVLRLEGLNELRFLELSFLTENADGHQRSLERLTSLNFINPSFFPGKTEVKLEKPQIGNKGAS